MQKTRIEQLRLALHENALDSFIIYNSVGLRYFTGFTGSNGLCFITGKAVLFITDFRYRDQAFSEVRADDIIISSGLLIESLDQLSQFKESKRIGFDPDCFSYADFQILENLASRRIFPCENIITDILSVKSTEEIGAIQRACEITVSAYGKIQLLLKENVTERDIAAEISYLIRKEGGDGVAFEPHVLFGANTAYPHGKPGGKQLKKGELVQLDYGVVFNGYCSDFSRCLTLGKPEREQKEIYLAVLSAHRKTVEMIKPGVPALSIDETARESIKMCGFDGYFGHATGHGVGLEVHGHPKINSKNKNPVKPGHVFTVEPGIYIPGFCGVRIEDTVCVEQAGAVILSECKRDLIQL